MKKALIKKIASISAMSKSLVILMGGIHVGIALDQLLVKKNFAMAFIYTNYALAYVGWWFVL